MRKSNQRDLILDIVNNSYNHPTAVDIYEEARKTIANISLGTVYRNLGTLSDSGLIREIKGVDNISRYDHTNEHSHYMCTECGYIEDLTKSYITPPTNINGNMVKDCEVKFTGICKSCIEKKGK